MTTTASMTLSSLGTAALYYAEVHGFAVFALHSAPSPGTCSCARPDCKNEGKHPRTEHGLKDATKDPATIRAWWARWPDANIGIATGSASGFDVIDVDTRKQGDENLAELEREHGALPPTPQSNTGGGGQHLCVAPSVPPLTNSQGRIARGVDVRAEGGYIVAPPSVHESGRPYVWEAGRAPGELPFATPPAWLVERARRRPVAAVPALVASSHPLTDRIKRASAYLAKVDPAVAGEGGHDQTWHAARALVRGFDLPSAVALDMLAREFNPRCRPAWSARELEHKVESAERDATAPVGYLLDVPGRAAPPKRARAPLAAVPAPVAAEPEGEAPASPREPGDDSAEEDPAPAAAAAPPAPTSAGWESALTRNGRGDLKNTYGNACLILRNTYGDRLTYNEMRLSPCLDAHPVTDGDLGRVREDLERVWGLLPSTETTACALRQVSEERSFHPVRTWLSSLTWDGTTRINRVAAEVLGAEPDPLTLRMLRCWFVSAVARVMAPGCKVDTALVLQGKQGFLKSTFFAVLGGAWFSDTQMDISNKDSLLQLAFTWIYEWPEIETITGRKQASEVKAFITSRYDTFRPPFARAVVQHYRSTVIVGSTNPEQFLNDPTGSRRFWVVRISQRINKKLLEEWREQLWAEAVAAYESREEWWLEAAEEDEREAAAEQHQLEDAIDNAIASWLDDPACRRLLHDRAANPLASGGAYLTVGDVMEKALKLEPGKWDRPTQIRVGISMHRLGWRKDRPTISGRRIWVYREPMETGPP